MMFPVKLVKLLTKGLAPGGTSEALVQMKIVFNETVVATGTGGGTFAMARVTAVVGQPAVNGLGEEGFVRAVGGGEDTFMSGPVDDMEVSRAPVVFVL